ncbi:sensor histidine kinase [Neptunomonas qingdaonensis]|uniref:histidine kinase n=1 Tax=Neptunomonas qingdaonensis TaxID=1045558 RepID=A0A1I2Q4L0_9GAMM|nr:ATP-binding protein [Neptunomonas qingdaonensis]SFG20776.1 Histidine kinase-, DNA gyrase B-, and HSP90-like ATPase [Neptunomonas qingdaonensis]
MIDKLRLWGGFLPLLFSSRRNHHVSYKPPSSDYSEMALDIAMSPDLGQTLPVLINSIQNDFKRALGCDLFLLLPGTSNNELTVYHATSVSPLPGQTNQLRYHCKANTGFGNNPSGLKITAFEGTIHAEQIALSTGNQPGWLMLTFPNSLPGAEFIQRNTSPLNKSLSRGLIAWQQQQTRIEKAISSERQAHAAELHDSMAQVLGYMRMRTAKLATLCEERRYEPLKGLADDLSTQAHSAYRQTRELIVNSRLSMQGCTLKEAIYKSVQEFEERSGIVFEVDNRTLNATHITSPDDLQILYIVREALSNIVRHSRASHARVILLPDKNRCLLIKIQDNGTGIAIKQGRHDSFGLKIMQERADRIKARLAILPRLGNGTSVELTVPWRELK